MIETVVTTLVDTFPRLRKKKPTILFGICMFMFVTGLFLCYEGKTNKIYHHYIISSRILIKFIQ